jgi:hypothetical protein
MRVNVCPVKSSGFATAVIMETRDPRKAEKVDATEFLVDVILP